MCMATRATILITIILLLGVESKNYPFIDLTLPCVHFNVSSWATLPFWNLVSLLSVTPCLVYKPIEKIKFLLMFQLELSAFLIGIFFYKHLKIWAKSSSWRSFICKTTKQFKLNNSDWWHTKSEFPFFSHLSHFSGSLPFVNRI